MHKRVAYLSEGDPDTPPQTYYTVLVENIPAKLRNNQKLYEFFNKLFPGMFISAHIT